MNKEEIIELVKNEIVEVLPLVKKDEIMAEKKLVDYGANSLDRAEVAIKCMTKLNIKIPPEKLGEVKNINDLCEILYEFKTNH